MPILNIPNPTIEINPQELADRLGWRRTGPNSWRSPHYCGGQTELGHNPGLSIRAGDAGKMLVHCHYGCDNDDAYKAVTDAAGGEYRYQPHIVVSAPRHKRPFVEPNYRAPADVSLIPGSGWPELHGGGTYTELLSTMRDVWVSWAAYDLADGRPRKMLRRFPPQPDGPKAKWDGDVDRSPWGLAPFIWRAGSPMVLCEGEKAGAALYCAPGTHGVASVPGTSELQNADYREFAGKHIIIWSDNDHPTFHPKTGRLLPKGPKAAAVAADRIQAAGATSVTMVSLEAVAAICPDDGADAADVPLSEIPALIAAARVSCQPPAADDFLSRLDDVLNGVSMEDLSAELDAYLTQEFARKSLPPTPANKKCRLDGGGYIPAPTVGTTLIPEPLRRSGQYRCVGKMQRTRKVRRPNGSICRVDLACDDCGPCQNYWIAYKRFQYSLQVTDGIQTILRVNDLASPEEAQALITSMGRRTGGTRVNIIRGQHYAFEAIVVYPGVISAEAIANTQRALVRNGLVGTIETRHVSAAEVGEFLDYRTKFAGGLVPVRFLQWAKPPEEPSDYASVPDGIALAANVQHLPLLSDSLRKDPELGPYMDTGKETPEKRVTNRECRAAINTGRWVDGRRFYIYLWDDCLDALAVGDADTYDYRLAMRELIEDAGYDGPDGLIDNTFAVPGRPRTAPALLRSP